MSYTTAGQPQGKAMSYTNLIREAMIGEIVAINGYRYHIASTDNKELRELWHHIMEDEKKHYGMFLELLRYYDKEEYKRYMKAKKDVKITGTIKEDYSPEISKGILLNFLREDIKGELEAVILYEEHLLKIPYADIRNVFSNIINDEKEHTEELTIALLKLDKDKYGPISRI